MNARTTHGQCFRGADPPEPREYVGSLEMSVQVGRRTEQAAARWAHRTDALAAWLVAEWQRKWISRRPRGRKGEALKVPTGGLEIGTEPMVLKV